MCSFLQRYPLVGRLVSGPGLVDRIGSGVQVSASFQIFALRMLLFYTLRGELHPGIFSSGNLRGQMFAGGYLLESVFINMPSSSNCQNLGAWPTLEAVPSGPLELPCITFVWNVT